jgi:NAD(P)-dependent dehydrogenase (short-subunit alcohol dehydrogenase family)
MSQESLVAVVTGASRGAGKGIAIALGGHGCTVYVTGRSQKAGDHALPGTISDTADRVTSAGGKGIAIRCDHGNDEDTEALFDQVKSECGRVDILVNNAAAVHDELTQPGNFWEKPLKLADMIEVGIRSSYVASWHAVPMMIDHGRGLIVFTSASGAVHYSLGPAYGAHKAGIDKMSFDLATEFREAGVNIASVSIWMGAVLTDRLKMVIESDREKFGALEAVSETPEFTGHVIRALYDDPELAELSGQTLIGAELAVKYGIEDEGGRQPPSFRDTHEIEPHTNYPVIVR